MSLPSLQTTVCVKVPRTATVELPDTTRLPKHPGYNWDDPAFQKYHLKNQKLQAERFGKTGKYQPTFVKKKVATDETQFMESTRKMAQCLTNVAGSCDDTQQWVDMDTKVLRFFGYWQEAAVESPAETVRLRKVVIHFFLKDETLMVLEPREANSGLQGGTLVQRHRVPVDTEELGQRQSQRSLSDGDRFLTIDDLNVGVDVMIYGKKVHIVDCDDFTRDFLGTLGADVPPAEGYPHDEYFEAHRPKIESYRGTTHTANLGQRQTIEDFKKGRLHYPSEKKRVQRFLSEGGKVCRFWAYWDDRASPHGDFRTFEIRYYIEDDTVEVLERMPANSGRDPCRTFCGRRRLPKSGKHSKALELTFSSRVNGIREPTLGSKGDEYYELADLDIGVNIDAYGRTLHIYGADLWTREYLREECNRELPEDENIEGFTTKPSPPVLRPPPHNGFGTEEDSAGNCKSLVLRAPRQDLVKWHKHADTSLRFKLKFHEPADANDAMRNFILTFFMADDTLMINEISTRNSGFLGGRFLKRQKVKKFNGEGPRCYLTHEDITPGKVLSICGHAFEVLEMDKFTATFKEANRKPTTSITPERVKGLTNQLRQAILVRHMTLTDAFRHYDTDKDGLLPLHEMADIFRRLHMKVTEEEVMAVMRQFDLNDDGKVSLNEFVKGITGDTLKSYLDGQDAEFGPVKDVEGREGQYLEVSANKAPELMRERVLRTFKEKLESRQINVFEMYRLLSTMPSAYPSRPGGQRDVSSLTNGGTDSMLGPVQLRRGVVERFNFCFTEEELDTLIEFFFPDLPKELYLAPREATAAYRMSLAEFQERWNVMQELGHLKASDGLDEHALPRC